MAHAEHVAIVVGRNRRVYARVYKPTSRMEWYIKRFSKHYLESERSKSFFEGFAPSGMTLERPNDTTWVFRVSYKEIA